MFHSAEAMIPDSRWRFSQKQGETCVFYWSTHFKPFPQKSKTNAWPYKTPSIYLKNRRCFDFFGNHVYRESRKRKLVWMGQKLQKRKRLAKALVTLMFKKQACHEHGVALARDMFNSVWGASILIGSLQCVRRQHFNRKFTVCEAPAF